MSESKLSAALASSQFPVDELFAPLAQQIQSNKVSRYILQAPPGSGKTTRIPLFLLNQLKDDSNKKILMLEPRRIAAIHVAEFMAKSIGESCGQTIGYRVRKDNKVSQHTRLEIVTEGVLTRLLLNDPELTEYDWILFDEFHERSVHGDTGLALSLEVQDSLREDLNIMVMSATLDNKSLSSLLGTAHLFTAEGRQFPIDIEYVSANLAGAVSSHSIAEGTASKIKNLISNNRLNGDTLVFLPGIGEINRVKNQLDTWLLEENNQVEVIVLPLYGALPLKEQKRAIEPVSKNQIKIILATNIAETSLTIDGVKMVIDSGYEREATFDSQRHINRIELKRISQASANQRAGRAGRQGPGHCIRLWSQDQHQSLAPHTTPEIKRTDPKSLALTLASWGNIEPEPEYWLDLPATGLYTYSKEFLIKQNLLTNNLQLNSAGKFAATLPLPPELGAMIFYSKNLTENHLLKSFYKEHSQSEPIYTAIWLAAFLSEIRQQKTVYLNQTDKLLDTNNSTVLKEAQRIARLMGTSFVLSKLDFKLIPLLLIQFCRVHIAKRIRDEQFFTSEGWRCQSPKDQKIKPDWIYVVDAGSEKTATIRSFIELDSTWLNQFGDMLVEENIIQIESKIIWDNEAGRVLSRNQKKLGEILISETPSKDISPEEIHQGLLDGVRQNGLAVLPWDNSSTQLKNRMQSLQLIMESDKEPKQPLPNCSDEGLLDQLDQWLLPFLDHHQSLNDLKTLPLSSALKSYLDWPAQQELDSAFPETWLAPSGNKIFIQYEKDKAIIAIKLQELFGTSETPTIGHPKLKVEFHLLSPAKRPVQITQDLASFWENGYPEVRKELRIKYAKHPWPVDPLTAIATHKTKKAMNR